MRLFRVITISLLLMSSTVAVAKRSLNVYLWGEDIPKSIIHQFEKKTGINVHISSYDNNETMFTKLRASNQRTYDVIMPSGNYIERLRNLSLIKKLDHHKLANIKNLDPIFNQLPYDPKNHYSIPLTWGSSGIFYNKKYITNPPKSWQALWKKTWQRKLLLLDDPREIFAMSLFSLGYSPNDTNPMHIKVAYEHLKKLMPNIKLFANDGLQAIMIDEDAAVGVAWNNDVFKSNQENEQLKFIYPKEGFILWVDNLAITTNAPHPEEAYEFINFMLEPEIAAQIGKLRGLAITNQAGKSLLPSSMQNNKVIYPDKKILKQGYFQHDVGEKIITLYNHYWQLLKQMI